KREKLKPKLKIKFNPLIATSETSLVPDYALSDQKWGVNFSMPILMRKERADIQKVEIKMAENQLDINNKRNELQNKIENSLRQQDILQAQLALQEQSVEGYRRLLEGENEKFRFGESSVFLVNKRQEKYINGRLKRIDLFIKIQMEKLAYRYYINRIDVQ
ncbi:MAG: TolC family protein, partial [Bacteroidota bacterium]